MGILKNIFNNDNWKYKPQSKPYTLLYDLSDQLINNAPKRIPYKSWLEGIILLATYMDYALQHHPIARTIIRGANIKELIVHAHYWRYTLDENFIKERMKLYENEILKTFIYNDDRYVGGILSRCIFKKPLISEYERNMDFELDIYLITILPFFFKKIDEYVDSASKKWIVHGGK